MCLQCVNIELDEFIFNNKDDLHISVDFIRNSKIFEKYYKDNKNMTIETAKKAMMEVNENILRNENIKYRVRDLHVHTKDWATIMAMECIKEIEEKLDKK